MTAQDMLRRRYQKALADIGDTERDYTTQSVTKNAQRMGEMEGGFGANEQARIRSEAEEVRKDTTEGYNLESTYLKNIEEEEKERARKAKLGGFLQAGATLLGAALALPTGGMSVAAGAALGGTLGSIGNTLYGTGSAPSMDFSFLGEWEDYRKRIKPPTDTTDTTDTYDKTEYQIEDTGRLT